MIANIELARRRFTVDEYHRMTQSAILTRMDRVELIDGEIIQMSPPGQRHAACVAQLVGRLIPLLGDRALLWPHSPVRLPRDTEPRPDIVLLRPRPDRYFRFPARPEDILLLVEVSDVSYRYDRGVKLPLYARAGVPEVWIVDLTHDEVEVHREPGLRGYASASRAQRGGRLTLTAFSGTTLNVDAVLSPP